MSPTSVPRAPSAGAGVPPPAIQKRIVLDLDRCIECNSCAAACFLNPAGAGPAVAPARAGAALLPMLCRQCASPACVEACPVEAMVRDDRGVVRRRAFRCIGCGSCSRACPFGVLGEELGGLRTFLRSKDAFSGRLMAKCDLCQDRLAADPQAEPRCVAACPSGALRFVETAPAAAQGLDLLGGRTVGQDLFARRTR